MVSGSLLVETTLLPDNGLRDYESNVIVPYRYTVDAGQGVLYRKCSKPGAINQRGPEELTVNFVAACLHDEPYHRFELH